MKTLRTLLPTLVLAGLTTANQLAAADFKATWKNTDTVVWVGLDYSLVRMIGPGDFRNPDVIFPNMLDAWNDLFLREQIDDLNKVLGKRITLDTGGIADRNKAADEKQIIPTPGPNDSAEQTHLTNEDLAKAVRAYQLEAKSGLGLVFVVDRLVKPSQKGAIHVVYFDIASREVLSSTRQIQAASGAGFRNYWFGVVKRVVRKAKP